MSDWVYAGVGAGMLLWLGYLGIFAALEWALKRKASSVDAVFGDGE